MEVSIVSSSSSVNAGFAPLSRSFPGRKSASFAAFPRSRYLGSPCRSLFLRRARVSRSSRVSSSSSSSSSSGEDGKKSIRLTIEAQAVGNSENAKLVIEVPESVSAKDGSVPRERVSHVASESAVESPEKVQKEAEDEAKPIIASDRHLKQAAEGLKEKADEASETEAEHLGSSDNKIGGATPRESVSHVASESAVESPDKVHEEAEEEAKPIIASDKHLKEAAQGLKEKADEASEIEAEHLSDNNKIGEQGSDGDLPRESVTHVASESAVESPEKLHEDAEEEAKPVASKIGHPVEEVAEELKDKAGEVSKIEAEHLGSSPQEGIVDLEEIKKGVAQAVQSGVEGAKWGVETATQSSQKAREGLEVAKEAMQKRAKVLAETAEEAGLKGSQVVEAAKKGLEELRQRMGGVPEVASRAAEEVQKNVQQVQKSVEQQVMALKQQVEESDNEVGKLKQKSDTEVEKLEKELEKGTEVLERGAVQNGVPVEERHRAVESEDVNKDGDEALKKQRREEGEQRRFEAGNGELAPGVEKAIKEHVDPALSSLREELDEEAEIGDGNEHLKNPKDLAPHDGYAPIQDPRDKQ